MEKNLKVIKWFNFFTHFKLYAPIAILYFAEVSGSFALGMSIYAISTISAAISEIPTGIYSDMIGRRKTVIVGSFSAVLFAIFYAIGGSYWFLVIGAIFEGISMSFFSGNNDALLYDTLIELGEQENYSDWLGKLSSWFQLALAISAIFGGIIGNFSFTLVMWISVMSQLMAFVTSFFLIEPKINSEKSGNIYEHMKEAFVYFVKNKKIRLLSISSMITFGIGEATWHFQAAFYKLLWPIWAIGAVKTISNFGAYLGFKYSGAILKRIKPAKLLLTSNIYSRSINLIAVAIPTVLSPLPMTSTSVWYGLTRIAKSTLLQREFTDKQRATMGSFDSLLGSIFYGIMAILLGLTADTLTPIVAMLIAQLLLVPTIWLNWKLFKHKE